jgi:plasmid stability protein
MSENKSLIVRNIPENIHKELRKKAIDDDKSLSDYVLNLIIKDVGLKPDPKSKK